MTDLRNNQVHAKLFEAPTLELVMFRLSWHTQTVMVRNLSSQAVLGSSIIHTSHHGAIMKPLQESNASVSVILLFY